MCLDLTLQYGETVKERFDGTFVTPGMGRVHMPITIAGMGHCKILEEGLGVHGYKTSSSSLKMLLAFVVIFVGGIMFSVVTGIAAEFSGVVIVALLFAANRFFAKKEASDEVYEFIVPWEKISGVTTIEENVVLTVKKFKPKGELYFIPNEEPSAFIYVINERIGAK